MTNEPEIYPPPKASTRPGSRPSSLMIDGVIVRELNEARREFDAGIPSALDPLLTLDQVKRLTSWSRTSIYRHIRAGTFPAPLKIGPSRIAWRASDLCAYVASLPKAA